MSISLLERLAVNYLCLGQLELARTALRDLHHADPHAAQKILQAVLVDVTSLKGRVGPITTAHLAWFCAGELRALSKLAVDEGPLALEIAAAQHQLLRQVARELLEQEHQKGQLSSAYLSELLALLQFQGGGDPDAVKKTSSLTAGGGTGALKWLVTNFPELAVELLGGGVRGKESVAEGQDQESISSVRLEGVFADTISELAATGKGLEGCRVLQTYGSMSGPDGAMRSVLELLYQSLTTMEVPEAEELLEELFQCVTASGSIYTNQLLEDVLTRRMQDEVERPPDPGGGFLLPPSLFRACHDLEQLNLEETGGFDAPARKQHVIQRALAHLYHESRLHGWIMMQVVLNAALSLLEERNFIKATYVLEVFPKLRPLVVVLGWDLLQADTAAREELIEHLWKPYRVLGGGSSEHEGQSSVVESLCEELCYRLQLATFVARSPPAGMSPTWPNSSADFATNLALERLSTHSPLRVLFDLVPSSSSATLLEFVTRQPAGCNRRTAQARQQDTELLHMHFALQAALKSLSCMEAAASLSEEAEENDMQVALVALQEMEAHLHAIKTPAKVVWLIGLLTSLLQTDLSPLHTTKPFAPLLSSPSKRQRTQTPPPRPSLPPSALPFIRAIIAVARRQLPAVEDIVGASLQRPRGPGARAPGQRAWVDRTAGLQRLLEDSEWRLALLEKLAPTPGGSWGWHQALGILRAAPAVLLNMCVQQREYELGEEVVHRFALPEEEAASLKLAEWIENAVARSGEEASTSWLGKGGSSQEPLDFSSLRVPLSPTTSLLLCLDVAAASAATPALCNKLLLQAEGIVQKGLAGSKEKGGSKALPKKLAPDRPAEQDSFTWQVAGRLIQRLQDIQTQDATVPLQALLSGSRGATQLASLVAAQLVRVLPRPGPKPKAIATLQQTITDSQEGKRQFLSGKLHNLVKALAEEEELKVPAAQEKGGASTGLLGIALPGAATSKLPAGSSVRAPAYLSSFIQYVASIGDIVDDADTTHTFNFFSLLYERPSDLLTRLVFERRSADSASKAAALMGVDLVLQVVSACVPPVFPPGVAPQLAGKEARSPLFPLQLDVVRHLARSSPLRAVLACFFNIEQQKEERDKPASPARGAKLSSVDFLDFALEQSARFPSLYRWLQLQAQTRKLSKSTATQKATLPTEANKSAATSVDVKRFKRLRSPEADASESDEGSLPSTPTAVSKRQSPAKEAPLLKPAVQGVPSTAGAVLCDWEDESFYQEQLKKLVAAGKLQEALALAESALPGGAPDELLQLLIDPPRTTPPPSYTAATAAAQSWSYCLRLKDKDLAARLALKWAHAWALGVEKPLPLQGRGMLGFAEATVCGSRHLAKWELRPALEVLDMCHHHLSANADLRAEVSEKKEQLERYSRILTADSRFSTWQEVAALYSSDPEGLALRLASRGAVDVAVEVAQACQLPLPLRHELQSRRLLKLLTGEPRSGGGSAAGLRFLQTLPSEESALQVALSALPLLPTLPPKQLLVREFLVRRKGQLSDAERTQLGALWVGLRVLSSLPLPWQQRCAALAPHPPLILETHLMWKQLKTSGELLRTCPSLRDDALVSRYLVKALSLPPEAPPSGAPVDRRGGDGAAASPGRTLSAQPGPAKRRSAPEIPPTVRRSSWSGPAHNFWAAARQTLLGASEPAPMASPAAAPSRPRLPPALPPTQSAAWEAMAGGEVGGQQLQQAVQQGGLPEARVGISLAEDGVLTGEPAKDTLLRRAHRYEGAPSLPLAQAIMRLYSSKGVAAKETLDVCEAMAEQALSSNALPVGAGAPAVERGLRAAHVHAEVLKHVQSVLLEAGDESSALGARAEALLLKLEVLQSLLSEGVAVSVEEVVDPAACAALRDRLLQAERYQLAILTAEKLEVDAAPVWEAWGLALLKLGELAKARSKLRQAVQLSEEKAPEVILRAVASLEGTPPTDLKSAKSIYEHTARTVLLSSEDALSFDSYLNVLAVPDLAAPHWPLRRSSDESAHGSERGGTAGSAPPASSTEATSCLDESRYAECVHYLQQYAPQELLPFMFRHGRFADACQAFLSALPSPATPSPSPSTTPSSKGGAGDQLATELGTVEELCELCVGYGAMAALQQALAARTEEETSSANQRAALLQRIGSFCQTHRHFHHLYAVQVLLKDPVAAGLTCIQLFLNAALQEDALQHLERAKRHFDEGLAARQAEMAAAGGALRKPKDSRKSASAKLTEEELIRYSTRLALQSEIVRVFGDSEGPPWKHSIFGNPNDAETHKRRLEVAEELVKRSFDLAFRVIYDFGLPAVDIYAGAAQSLARRKRTSALADLLRNIKGTIEEDERDQVLLAAIGIYANEHKEHPSFLIDQLSNSHKKVLACVASGKLKSAFQFASRANNMADVQLVAHQARETGQLTVMDMCHQYMARQHQQAS